MPATMPIFLRSIPEIKSRPAIIAPTTAVVPRSPPCMRRAIAIKKPGAISAGALILNFSLRSLRARIRLAHSMRRNLINSPGCTSTTRRLIQFRFPLTVLPTPGIKTMASKPIEIMSPNFAINSQRSIDSRAKDIAVGIATTRNINCLIATANAYPFVSIA